MVKFVVDESGERVFTCADDKDAEDKVVLLRSEGRIAYVAVNPDVPGNGTWLQYDPASAVLIVEGVKIAREVFVNLSAWPVGQAFRLAQRDGEVIVLETLKHADILEIEQTHEKLEALEHLIVLAGGVEEGQSTVETLKRILAEATADKLALITAKESPAPQASPEGTPQSSGLVGSAAGDEQKGSPK